MAALALTLGCSSETWKRATYDTLQNINQQECLKNPNADCERQEGYDDYQRKREEVRRDE